MTETETKLIEITDYMNKRFNQESDEYDVFFGSKPQVIKYDETTAISTWGCGAIVCIGSGLFFLDEDDGFWYNNSYVLKDRINNDGTYSDFAIHYAMQSPFSIGWSTGFAEAIIRLNKYVEENGYPVYFSGTKHICHYTLNKKENVEYE